MHVIYEVWFWLLVIAIIGLIISLILFETLSEVAAGQTTTPTWIWVIYILSITLIVVALIIFVYRSYIEQRQVELLEACCGIVPIVEKKKLICPPPCPVEDPCPKSCNNRVPIPDVMAVQPVESVVQPVQPVQPVQELRIIRQVPVQGSVSNLPAIASNGARMY